MPSTDDWLVEDDGQGGKAWEGDFWVDTEAQGHIESMLEVRRRRPRGKHHSVLVLHAVDSHFARCKGVRVRAL
jgi:hypothetical protein